VEEDREKGASWRGHAQDRGGRRVEHTVAEGTGPSTPWTRPCAAPWRNSTGAQDMTLVDFKVRVINARRGRPPRCGCSSTPATTPRSGARSASPRTSSKPPGRPCGRRRVQAPEGQPSPALSPSRACGTFHGDGPHPSPRAGETDSVPFRRRALGRSRVGSGAGRGPRPPVPRSSLTAFGASGGPGAALRFALVTRRPVEVARVPPDPAAWIQALALRDRDPEPGPGSPPPTPCGGP